VVFSYALEQLISGFGEYFLKKPPLKILVSAAMSAVHGSPYVSHRRWRIYIKALAVGNKYFQGR
jgi:hypothetical protein